MNDYMNSNQLDGKIIMTLTFLEVPFFLTSTFSNTSQHMGRNDFEELDWELHLGQER